MKKTKSSDEEPERTDHPGRAEFSAGVKRTVAGRSGYQCSFPGCSTLTIGPGRGTDTVSNTGVAAHIYSAAPSGPRGQGILSRFDLTSTSNAIWLCQTHAKLVDNNRGSDFPPAVLVSYKGLHETATMRRHMGVNAPLGWFHEIRMLRGPLFLVPSTVRFGKLTILTGDNGAGKSAIWQWLSLASSSTWAYRRWSRKLGANSPLFIEITYFNPLKNTVSVTMGDNGGMTFLLNGNPVPFIPLQTRFIVIVRPDQALLSDPEKEAWETWSDVQRLSAALHLDAIELENILPYVGDSNRFVRKVWVETNSSDFADKPRRGEIRVQLSTHGNFYPSFDMLSGGEQIDVLIEIGIAIARFSAQYVPTVLVLDAFRAIDSSGQQNWASYLSAPEHLFQTIVETNLDPELDELATSAGWEVVTLNGKPPRVEIHQIGGTGP